MTEKTSAPPLEIIEINKLGDNPKFVGIEAFGAGRCRLICLKDLAAPWSQCVHLAPHRAQHPAQTGR